MRFKFIFLSTIILGSNSLGSNIDIYLQLLIDELKQLWSSRALTYDVLRKQNFPLQATLLQTISDLPTYGMVFSWSIHEKLACPYYIKNNKAFTLTNSGKTYFFTITNGFCKRIND